MSACALQACHDDALDVFAMTDARARELVAPILREVLELRELGVPERKVEVLLDALRQCCVYNDQLGAAARRLAGKLEELATVVNALNVKALAAELRPHLAVIADPAHADGIAYYTAVCSVRDIIGITPPERLTGGGMKAALGTSRFGLLMDLIDVPGTASAKSTSTTGRAGGEADGTADPPRSRLPRLELTGRAA